jgi:hypothetical protein
VDLDDAEALLSSALENELLAEDVGGGKTGLGSPLALETGTPNVPVVAP